jgi:hypothetical protein
MGRVYHSFLKDVPAATAKIISNTSEEHQNMQNRRRKL